MLDILEIIIKWLQVGVTNATDKPLTLKIQNFARDLVPSARTTCTIASRVNFFDTKLSVNVDSQGFLNNQIPTLTYLKTFLYHESWLSMHTNNFTTTSTMYLYCDYRRIGWTPWRGEFTIFTLAFSTIIVVANFFSTSHISFITVQSYSRSNSESKTKRSLVRQFVFRPSKLQHYFNPQPPLTKLTLSWIVPWATWWVQSRLL